MGSHFTNDDLVKQSRMADNYSFAETFAGEREGARVTDITCTPKPDAAVVWGRVVVTVRQEDGMPLSVRYFDEELKPARTLTFAAFQKVGHRMLPLLARMMPEAKPGEATELRYANIVFDTPLPDDLFSLRSVQR